VCSRERNVADDGRQRSREFAKATAFQAIIHESLSCVGDPSFHLLNPLGFALAARVFALGDCARIKGMGNWRL
jgi:hypothetical protein